MPIRTSAKAIIVHNERVLLTRMQLDGSSWYALPGGGQHHGETLDRTIMRECVEEVDAIVHVGPLIHVREYIGRNHEFAAHDAGAHQVELWFLCGYVGDTASDSKNMDQHQIGHEWVDIAKLGGLPMYPKITPELILAALKGNASSVYLGDVN